MAKLALSKEKPLTDAIRLLGEMTPEDFDAFVPSNMWEKSAKRMFDAMLAGDGKSMESTRAFNAIADRIQDRPASAKEDNAAKSAPKILVVDLPRRQEAPRINTPATRALPPVTPDQL